MRSRSVLMLASVTMILVATGIGNAFATTHWYTGQVASTFSSTSDVQFTSTISQSKSVSHGDFLAWGNTWYNDCSGSSVTPKAQYGGSPTGGASGGWKTYSAISYGKYYPGPNPTQSQGIDDSKVLDTASGSYSEGINHLYNYGGTDYATGYNWDMKFSV